ncbi:60S ribosomal protein L18a isoform X2 [Juglans microcarpa x Juglans regia]|uniref:60S ribosomal protein L18a isoform X2 n=1 Tax=Juglans microcarpa x Juglans regia TaxID=2249226 RepID=UPI001B7EC7C1|nr:60S ribosomal protein L18a isoform X2 [Juglans microcarpa x Juglans regia]
MSEDGKARGLIDDQQSQFHYGTFQGVANYNPPAPQPLPHPVVGFPQPVPPPGFTVDSRYNHQHHHHYGYQTVQGYAIVEGRPVRELSLPCCGIGMGWVLFITGFFLGGIPWYIGTFILLCVQVDYREKPGYVACTVAFHQYQVVGRALPTEADEHPKIYRMKLWATNEVRAKSKFWYFLRKLKKVKKSNGQMLAINEIFEKNPTKIKNYGIWLRYQSRTGYHNMYKEYRDTTLNGAVEQMYNEMASRHRVRFPCIQIIKTATVPAKLCKRESTKQFHNSKIKFPLVFKKVRPPTRKLKTTYKASRPNLFM